MTSSRYNQGLEFKTTNRAMMMTPAGRKPNKINTRTAKGKLGERIREARVKAGMTTYQLAEAIGSTNASVSRWEHGKVNVPLMALKMLAIALNTTVEELQG